MIKKLFSTGIGVGHAEGRGGDTTSRLRGASAAYKYGERFVRCFKVDLFFFSCKMPSWIHGLSLSQ